MPLLALAGPPGRGEASREKIGFGPRLGPVLGRTTSALGLRTPSQRGTPQWRGTRRSARPSSAL
eukprot:8277269-Pyramimonas_sp.AAC.1